LNSDTDLKGDNKEPYMLLNDNSISGVQWLQAEAEKYPTKKVSVYDIYPKSVVDRFLNNPNEVHGSAKQILDDLNNGVAISKKPIIQKNILAKGQTNGFDKYIVADGYHRIQALLAKGITEIEVKELPSDIQSKYPANEFKIKNEIENAIKEKKYQKAISGGRMTATDAKTIIESAGLEVPKDIAEQSIKETPKTDTLTQSGKVSKNSFGVKQNINNNEIFKKKASEIIDALAQDENIVLTFDLEKDDTNANVNNAREYRERQLKGAIFKNSRFDREGFWDKTLQEILSDTNIPEDVKRRVSALALSYEIANPKSEQLQRIAAAIRKRGNYQVSLGSLDLEFIAGASKDEILINIDDQLERILQVENVGDYIENVAQEELIHLLTNRLSTEKDYTDVYDEMSEDEINSVSKTYGILKTDKVNIGAEYVRMYIQNKVFGATTETNLLSEHPALLKILNKLLDFLNELVKSQPNKKISELVRRFENAISDVRGAQSIKETPNEGEVNLSTSAPKQSITKKAFTALTTMLKKAFPKVEFIGEKEAREIMGGSDKPSYQITMPDGSKKEVQPINDDVINGFYSPLEKVLNETKFDKLPAKQWVEKHTQFRGEEAKWTGLTDWLNQQQGSVSKADIQQYLKDNRIEVVEVVKGGIDYNAKNENLSYTGNDDIIFLKDNGRKTNYEIRKKKLGYYDVYDGAENIGTRGTLSEAKELAEANFNAENGNPQIDKNAATKFEGYQLEGEKENYAEKLVILPNKEVNISEFVDTNADYIIEAYKKSGKLVVEC
jgi:hypothetical protein